MGESEQNEQKDRRPCYRNLRNMVIYTKRGGSGNFLEGFHLAGTKRKNNDQKITV